MELQVIEVKTKELVDEQAEVSEQSEQLRIEWECYVVQQ
jgi:hypothetical protein